MSLKTLGSRTFAALAFGALTLHGTVPTEAVAAPAYYEGSGGFEDDWYPHPPRKEVRRDQSKDEQELIVILTVLIEEGLL